MNLIKKALLRDKLENSGMQSDWTQNDPIANNYIKNRLLYTEQELYFVCLNYIINSSTEGSTKKFQITVDDSGTISATEVV